MNIVLLRFNNSQPGRQDRKIQFAVLVSCNLYSVLRLRSEGEHVLESADEIFQSQNVRVNEDNQKKQQNPFLKKIMKRLNKRLTAHVYFIKKDSCVRTFSSLLVQ